VGWTRLITTHRLQLTAGLDHEQGFDCNDDNDDSDNDDDDERRRGGGGDEGRQGFENRKTEKRVGGGI
jgi:hypothetical protein